MVYFPTVTYIYNKNQPNVGKYTIHGWYGVWCFKIRDAKFIMKDLYRSQTLRMGLVYLPTFTYPRLPTCR